MAKNKDKAESASPEDTSRAMLAISRALADPRRVELFRRIASSGAAAQCSDLRACLAMQPPTLSHHMKQLETAGLIETRREGKFVRAEVRRKVWKSYLQYLKTLSG